jgi:two-component system, NtrC family, sensor histidine kinase KinB
VGLAIAREIVRAHGGEIWVDSGPGPGAVFSFTLPRADHAGTPTDGDASG